MLQVIKAEDVRDGEPRIWIETPQPVMHTESRRDRGCQPCGFAIVDRPAPTPTPDPLATVRAGLDLDAVERTWNFGKVMADPLGARNVIKSLIAEARALRRYYDAAGPEHNLLALLDLYHEREQAAIAKLAEAKRLGLEACSIGRACVKADCNCRIGAIRAALEAL